MARPIKFGIDYFPVDVDIFDDEKVIPVSSEFGAQGEAVIIRLLCSIYRNGYYVECTESFIYKIAKQANVNHEVVLGVITGLVKWGFFDEGVYSAYNVISSAGIQARWKEAVRKRTILRDSLPFWIENEGSKKLVSAEETPISAPEIPQNDMETTSKRLETTQKKRKENIYKEIYKESDFDPAFVEPMKTWLAYKKQRRESYKTAQSIKACYENLLEISRGSPEQAKKIVNKAMANNWAGLFPLKDYELNNHQNGSNSNTAIQGKNQATGTRSTTLQA